MNNEEKDINKTSAPNESSVSNEALVSSGTPVPGEINTENELQSEAINILEEAIIRNDTIPETKDTPGSNGAFPVGAFDTSKD